MYFIAREGRLSARNWSISLSRLKLWKLVPPLCVYLLGKDEIYDGVNVVRRSWNPGKGVVAELRYCIEGGMEEPGVVMWIAF